VTEAPQGSTEGSEERLAGAGAGLSQTGRSASDFVPGDPSADQYGDPGYDDPGYGDPKDGDRAPGTLPGGYADAGVTGGGETGGGDYAEAGRPESAETSQGS